jgi:hypothetical protein
VKWKDSPDLHPKMCARCGSPDCKWRCDHHDTNACDVEDEGYYTWLCDRCYWQSYGDS